MAELIEGKGGLLLTEAEIAEMVAIRHVHDAMGHGTSITVSLWPFYRRLVRRGLLTWKKGGAAWGPAFREVALTEKGFEVLRGIPDAEAILQRQMDLYDAEHEWDD